MTLLWWVGGWAHGQLLSRRATGRAAAPHALLPRQKVVMAITVLGIVGLTVYALLRRFRPPREMAALPPQQRAVLPDLVSDLINPRTAHSQLTGAMVMGLSMALHEHSVLDERWAHVVNHDLAGYHVAAHADVADIEAVWLDETDEHINPMGSRGVGEIGIVGASAAVANATYHATGIRVRELPLTPDLFLRGDPQSVAR